MNKVIAIAFICLLMGGCFIAAAKDAFPVLGSANIIYHWCKEIENGQADSADKQHK